MALRVALAAKTEITMAEPTTTTTTKEPKQTTPEENMQDTHSPLCIQVMMKGKTKRQKKQFT